MANQNIAFGKSFLNAKFKFLCLWEEINNITCRYETNTSIDKNLKFKQNCLVMIRPLYVNNRNENINYKNYNGWSNSNRSNFVDILF
jgi:hypothetical protein